MLLVVLLLVDDVYFLGKEAISLDDVVENGGKIYIRARRLEKGIPFLWRLSTDRKRLGIHREGSGGRSIEVGPGKDALIHSQDVFIQIEAIRTVLNAKITGDTKKLVIDPKAKHGADLAPRQSGFVPGDRMIDFTLPSLKGDEKIQLSAAKKKRTLVVFWCSWDSSRKGPADWATRRWKDVVVVPVAVGAEGRERARAYADFGARDPHWRVVSAFGIESFPQWVLVDELGFIRAMSDMKKPAPLDADLETAIANLGDIEEKKFHAWVPDEKRKLKELEEALKKKATPELRLALSRALCESDPNRAALEAKKAADENADSWEAAIHRAAALWQGGKNDDGVAVLREFLKKNDLQTLVRRQKWTVEFAEKIYGGDVDEAWLQAQEEKERGGG